MGLSTQEVRNLPLQTHSNFATRGDARRRPPTSDAAYRHTTNARGRGKQHHLQQLSSSLGVSSDGATNKAFGAARRRPQTSGALPRSKVRGSATKGGFDATSNSESLSDHICVKENAFAVRDLEER